MSLVALAPIANAEDLLSEEEDIDLLYEDRKAQGHRIISPIASFLVPGFGQMINQDFAKSLGHFGAYAAFTAAKRWYETDEEFNATRAYHTKHDENSIYVNRDKVLNGFYSTLQLSAMFYSSFDAYRVATLSRDDVPYGDIPVSKESFTDFALAPFTLEYLTDPYVLVPLGSAMLFLLGRGTSNVQNEKLVHYVYEDDTSINLLRATNISRHAGVAVSEEAFFRGAINTETVRYFGPATGIIASSVIFGLSHSGAGASADPQTALIYGLYLGYTHFQKKGKLGYNIALHYWWNVSVALSVIQRSKEAEVTIPVLSMEF